MFRHALLALLCSTTYAACGELKGSFTGVAIYSGLGPDYTTNFDGTPISGTFDLIDTYAPRGYDANNDNVYFVLNGESALTFNILGSSVAGSYSCRNTSADTTLVGDQSSPFPGTNDQLVDIFCNSSVGNTNYNSFLGLAGSNLFNSDDPTDLTAGTIDYAFDPRTSASDPYRTVFSGIFDEPAFATNVLLTSVTFDTTSVPEPPTASLLLFGIAGLVALRRKRRAWAIGADVMP